MLFQNKEIERVLNVNSNWLIGLGVFIAAIGVLALYMAVATTMLSVVFLGMSLLIAGVSICAYSIFARDGWRGFAMNLLLGVLYVVAGGLVLYNPVGSAFVLTAVIAYTFLFSGIARVVASAVLMFRGWGWACFSGVVTAALGVLILARWPEVSLFLLGTLIGIDMILFGAHLISFGFSTRTEVSAPFSRSTPRAA